MFPHPLRRPSRLALTAIASVFLIFVAQQKASAAFGSLVTSFNLQASRMAVDPVRPRIYATLTGSNAVAVIDTSTMTLVQVIPIGSEPLGLAVSPDGSRLYVANSGSTTNGVGVIDLTTLQTLPSLSTPEQPSDIAVGLNGRLYLTVGVDDNQDGDIMQISTSGTVPAVFFGSESSEGGDFLAISPDRTTLYYGDSGISPATLASYDVSTVTGTLSQTAPFGSVGSNGEDLEISHSGAFLCFAVGSGQGSYQISEIPTGNLAGSNGMFNTGAYPSNVTFSPDDAAVYSAPQGQNVLYAFDTTTFLVTGTFATPGDTSRLITDSSGKYLFVAGLNNYYSTNPTLNVYDTGRAAAVITSSTTALTGSGLPFSYQIVATNNPTSFNATSLPPGFSVNTYTGFITGTATSLGSTQVIISASNSTGVAMAELTINVQVPLTVAVSGSGSVTTGLAGTTYYSQGAQVTVTATPDAGYLFAGWTGDIASSTNPLEVTMNSPTSIQANFAVAPPTVASAVSIGEYGLGYTYQIMASGVGPFSYGTGELPGGLSLNSSTGLISGTPAESGSFTIALSATNTGGSNAGTLSLNIDAVLTVDGGGGGSTNPLGTHSLTSGSVVTLTATPYPGYLFQDWSGDIASSTNPVQFPVANEMTVVPHFVPWTAYQGTYNGLALAGTLANVSSGILTIHINKYGIVTGSVKIAGVAYSLSGTFNPDRILDVTAAARNKAPLSLQLYLDLSGSEPEITGTVGNGTWTSELIANSGPVYSARNPNPRAGLYTVALYSSTNSQVIPGGTGYATITVSAAGLARLAGTLADGTPFSTSAQLDSGGTLPVYSSLYGNQGCVEGGLYFESPANSGQLDGALTWIKPQTAQSTLFPAGFTTNLQPAGSSYTHGAQLTGTGGQLSFAGGNLSAPFSQQFSINSSHKIVIGQPNSHSVTYSVNAKTGIFSGKFRDGTTTRHYRGVILEQQDAGAGVFVDAIGSGTVEITVSP